MVFCDCYACESYELVEQHGQQLWQWLLTSCNCQLEAKQIVRKLVIGDYLDPESINKNCSENTIISID